MAPISKLEEKRNDIEMSFYYILQGYALFLSYRDEHDLLGIIFILKTSYRNEAKDSGYT